MKNRKLLLAFCGILTVGLLATGCGNKTQNTDTKNKTTTTTEKKSTTNDKKTEDKKADDKKSENKESTQSVSLKKWEGTWNDMSRYLDDEKLNSAYERLAKQTNTTVDEAKKTYKEKRKCEFGGLKIEGDTVTFLDNFANKDGKEVSKSDYTFVKTHTTKHGKHDLTWYEFKAKDTNAKYPVLMLMDLHNDEELKHFHFRYGSDANKILEGDSWFPAVVSPDSTLEQIEEEITE